MQSMKSYMRMKMTPSTPLNNPSFPNYFPDEPEFDDLILDEDFEDDYWDSDYWDDDYSWDYDEINQEP